MKKILFTLLAGLIGFTSYGQEDGKSLIEAYIGPLGNSFEAALNNASARRVHRRKYAQDQTHHGEDCPHWVRPNDTCLTASNRSEVHSESQ